MSTASTTYRVALLVLIHSFLRVQCLVDSPAAAFRNVVNKPFNAGQTGIVIAPDISPGHDDVDHGHGDLDANKPFTAGQPGIVIAPDISSGNGDLDHGHGDLDDLSYLIGAEAVARARAERAEAQAYGDARAVYTPTQMQWSDDVPASLMQTTAQLYSSQQRGQGDAVDYWQSAAPATQGAVSAAQVTSQQQVSASGTVTELSAAQPPAVVSFQTPLDEEIARAAAAARAVSQDTQRLATELQALQSVLVGGGAPAPSNLALGSVRFKDEPASNSTPAPAPAPAPAPPPSNSTNSTESSESSEDCGSNHDIPCGTLNQILTFNYKVSVLIGSIICGAIVLCCCCTFCGGICWRLRR